MAEGPALYPSYPSCTVFINVPAEQMIEWEALKKGPNTDTIWQSGANNTFTAPYPVSGLQ